MNTTFAVPRKLIEQLGCQTLSAILVYLTLCWLAPENGSSTCVSTAELARITGLCRRTIFVAVAHLEALGLINRAAERFGGANRFEIVALTSLTPLPEAVLPPVPDFLPAAVLADEDDLRSGDQPAGNSGEEVAAEGDENIVGGENSAEIETLDDAVARVYRPGVRATDLRRFVACDEETLRRCLERVSSRGVIAEGAPLRRFVDALLEERRALQL